MERVKKIWRQEPSYEPIEHDSDAVESSSEEPSKNLPSFSWLEYTIFLLLGVSMLWAWNMFLAAGPYFQHRFRSNDWIFENFQAAELSISTVANLGSMLVLTKLQVGADYPKRIITSLAINIIVFVLLALSTSVWLSISAAGYFSFLMLMVLSTSLATGLCQNGIFAYVSGFGEGRYTQGIMTGQAVAGVLPCIAQIVSVLSVQGDRPEPAAAGPGGEHQGSHGPPPVKSIAAFAYFLTATAISVCTLIAFFYLLARHRTLKQKQDMSPDVNDEPEEKQAVPLTLLGKKLFWLASGVFATFAVTMIFPVFTQRIVSVSDPRTAPPFLHPASFIPLAFLLWNAGDLLGRLLTAIPALSLIRRPRLVFALAIARIGFVGLYHLCNIRGHGAKVQSDVFYLFVVQLMFGLTNGFLGSTCMIGAGEWVEPDEREAAGGFMGLCLVSGLAVGSFASFFVSAT